MGKGCLVPLGFVGGAVAGWVFCMVIYLLLTTSDFEGANGMAVAFFVGPVVGLICGVGVALWLGLRKSKRPPIG